MTYGRLYGFERCEAALADGRRCTNRDRTTISENGAYLPYRVCNMHKQMGERVLRDTGELPEAWGHWWKRWRT